MDATPSASIAEERAYFAAIVMGAISCGLQAYLCLHSIHHIRHSHFSEGRKRFFAVYSFLLFACMTITLVCNVIVGQYIWIDARNVYPRGPGQAYVATGSWWVNVVGTITGDMATALGDGLLLSRVFIIFDKSILPSAFALLLYLATIAFAVVSTLISARPNQNILTGMAADFGLAWMALSVAFNVFVTGMIAGRILRAQKLFQVYASQDTSRPYTGVLSVLVESATPLAVSGIVTLAFYGLKHPATLPVAQLYGFFVVASPQLIILRVARGQAWSSQCRASESAEPSAIRFQTRSISFDPKEELAIVDSDSELGHSKA